MFQCHMEKQCCQIIYIYMYVKLHVHFFLLFREHYEGIIVILFELHVYWQFAREKKRRFPVMNLVQLHSEWGYNCKSTIGNTAV